MISRLRTIMVITHSPIDGGWITGCNRCWWRSHDAYRSETQARHAAAQHLWGKRHQDHTPRSCPRPEKLHHLTRDAAVRHIVALYARGRGNPDYRPYLCAGHNGAGCGWWHVGHDKRALQKRIRRTVRR